MSDLEIIRVLELEHGLWLAGFDDSDLPRLVFYDPGTQLPTPLGRSLQDVVNGTQSNNPRRKKWHALILGWIESRPGSHPADLRVRVAEKAAVLLK